MQTFGGRLASQKTRRSALDVPDRHFRRIWSLCGVGGTPFAHAVPSAVFYPVLYTLCDVFWVVSRPSAAFDVVQDVRPKTHLRLAGSGCGPLVSLPSWSQMSFATVSPTQPVAC